MLPVRVSNPGPPTYESGALPIALRGPAVYCMTGISGSISLIIREEHGMSCFPRVICEMTTKIPMAAHFKSV